MLRRDLIDEIIQVKPSTPVPPREGLPGRKASSPASRRGAATWAALEVGRRAENEGKMIVVILPDTGERYLSTWLFEAGEA